MARRAFLLATAVLVVVLAGVLGYSAWMVAVRYRRPRDGDGTDRGRQATSG